MRRNSYISLAQDAEEHSHLLRALESLQNLCTCGDIEFDRCAERGRAMTEEETLRFAMQALERAQASRLVRGPV